MPDVDYEAMSAGDAAPDDDLLRRLGEAVRRMRELDGIAADLAERAKRAADELRFLAERTVPGILDETGLSELRLADGTKVVVRTDLKVSTTGKYRPAINTWLEETGHDDIIKDEVTVPFGKDESERVGRVVAFLEDAGLQHDRRRYVAPQTLKALVNELMEAGEEVPLDRIGAFTYRSARLEAPRG